MAPESEAVCFGCGQSERTKHRLKGAWREREDMRRSATRAAGKRPRKVKRTSPTRIKQIAPKKTGRTSPTKVAKRSSPKKAKRTAPKRVTPTSSKRATPTSVAAMQARIEALEAEN